jgi:hypothetical protein
MCIHNDFFSVYIQIANASITHSQLVKTHQAMPFGNELIESEKCARTLCERGKSRQVINMY